MLQRIVSVILSVLAFLALALPALAQPLADPGSLTKYRATPGLVLSFDVVGATSGSVWGTDIYTDDSMVAAAAVHAGVLRAGERGVVTVELLGRQSAFQGSSRNGVASGSYGAWDGSYRFLGPDEAGRAADYGLPDPGNLTGYSSQLGARLTFYVVGANSGSLWGDGTYTADSTLAFAAVHAGVLKVGESGNVTVEIMGPQPSFNGAERNGVRSSPWGSYGSSYRFIEEAPAEQPAYSPKLDRASQSRGAAPPS